MTLTALTPRIIMAFAAVKFSFQTVTLTIQVPVGPVALAIQVMVDPVTFAIQASVSPVADSIHTLIGMVTLFFQSIRQAVPACLSCTICTLIKAIFNSITPGIQMRIYFISLAIQVMVDPVTFTIQVPVKPLTFAIQTIINLIAQIVIRKHYRAGQGRCQNTVRD